MKNQLSPKAVIVTLAAVAIVVIAAAVFVFKPGSSGPPLTPKPWHPPSNWAQDGKSK